MFYGGFLFRSLSFSFDGSGLSLITPPSINYVPLDARFFSTLHSSFSISHPQLISTISRFRMLYMGLYGGHFCVLHAKGIGFRVYLSALRRALYFFLGYNHITKYSLPQLVCAKPLKGYIFIHTARLDLFGTAIFQIRNLRFPDPYRGKGVRYRYQVIKFKPGKQRLRIIIFYRYASSYKFPISFY